MKNLFSYEALLDIWIAKSYLPIAIDNSPASISLPFSIFNLARCLRKSLEYLSLSNSFNKWTNLIKLLLLNSFLYFSVTLGWSFREKDFPWLISKKANCP